MACLLHDISKPETKTVNNGSVHFYAHQHLGSKKAAFIMRRLRFDTDTVRRTSHLIKYHMTPIVFHKEVLNGNGNMPKILKRLIRKVGEDNIYLLLDLVRCDIYSSANPRYEFMLALTKMVDECMAEHPSSIVSPISGAEIMKYFNLPQGKLIGEIKNYLTELVIDGKLEKDDMDGSIHEVWGFLNKEK